jgi:hypothetical protein
MEVWFVGHDASLQEYIWYDEVGHWTALHLAPAGSASVTSGIAAVSRIPNSVELWYVGSDGSINDYFWYEESGAGTFKVAPVDSTSTSGIAAVSRETNTMELWYVARNGSVQDLFWYDGAGPWQGFQLAPTGSASPTRGIAAVSTPFIPIPPGELGSPGTPGTMSLWFVGQNGSIQSAFWSERAGWQQISQVAPAGSVSLTSGIAVLEHSNVTYLWFVGQDGSIQNYNNAPPPPR